MTQGIRRQVNRSVYQPPHLSGDDWVVLGTALLRGARWLFGKKKPPTIVEARTTTAPVEVEVPTERIVVKDYVPVVTEPALREALTSSRRARRAAKVLVEETEQAAERLMAAEQRRERRNARRRKREHG